MRNEFKEVCQKTESLLLVNQNLEKLAPVIISKARKRIKQQLKTATVFQQVILLKCLTTKTTMKLLKLHNQIFTYWCKHAY